MTETAVPEPAQPHRPTLMTVHAHPDDETIGTGGTMAKAVAEGKRVVLITGTRGEMGEARQIEGPHRQAEFAAFEKFQSKLGPAVLRQLVARHVLVLEVRKRSGRRGLGRLR